MRQCLNDTLKHKNKLFYMSVFFYATSRLEKEKKQKYADILLRILFEIIQKIISIDL